MSDWNAERYHEVSAPQQAWGRRILDRLSVKGNEHALDLGCGTGRLTSVLAERLSRGRVVGLDRSPAMLQSASSWLREQSLEVPLVLGDGAALPFLSAFHVVFSAATFHWIHDHDALFRSIHDALKPGGRLLAQCGGGANVARLHARAERLMHDPRFASSFGGWSDPWFFADVDSTTHRLAAAGFVEIDVGIQAAPTSFPGPDAYEEFVTTVCLRPYLSCLSHADRGAFLTEMIQAAAGDDPAFTLDYWRLNISARRPA